MRPRFTIRALLIVTALLAAACYWWVARPTNMANRFKEALERGDYATARALWIADAEFHTDFEKTYNSLLPVKQWQVELEPRTWQDLRQGIRRMKLVYRERAADDPTWQNEGVMSPVVISAKGASFKPLPYSGGGYF